MFSNVYLLCTVVVMIRKVSVAITYELMETFVGKWWWGIYVLNINRAIKCCESIKQLFADLSFI